MKIINFSKICCILSDNNTNPSNNPTRIQKNIFINKAIFIDNNDNGSK